MGHRGGWYEEQASGLYLGFEPGIQIVDTNIKPQAPVNPDFAAGSHQDNRTLLELPPDSSRPYRQRPRRATRLARHLRRAAAGGNRGGSGLDSVIAYCGDRLPGARQALAFPAASEED